MAAFWEALTPTAVGAAATVLGVYMGAVVGRRNQDRQWIRDKKTAAYETFLQEFTAVEIELRQAYLDDRLPEVRWERFNAALVSVSLLADRDVGPAAARLADLIERFTLVFDGRARALEELRNIHSGLVQAQMNFVNAARRSLDPSHGDFDWQLGGPSPWYGIEHFHGQEDEAGTSEPLGGPQPRPSSN
ncbi:hypothetical protein FCH28_30135 [Streptomyces piniterrae]|uniref:Uncharacterized protein n=1 Tax=Streptomyces piniterrae TaxID=2571125 RepID=A0A4U0MUD1_9ACTN|nr:hypothetical protein [Streptomyces piniterrae]TJZ44589.1 hypothetical protein FCH28_30135 [Streptomyces piniterrae]